MKITKQELISAFNDNKSMNDIAKEFDLSLSTIRYWSKKYDLTSQYKSFKQQDFKNFNLKKSPCIGLLGDESHLDYHNWNESQEKSYSYVLGFYLGDGCLQHDKKKKTRSYTLFISNQANFHKMNQQISKSLEVLFQKKVVRIYKRKNSNCLNIKLTAVNLNLLFPHGEGKKHERKIVLEDWQLNLIEKFPKEFIKGMLESDGCRFQARKICSTYYVYKFDNKSCDLHEILQRIAKILNLHFTFTSSKGNKIHTTSFYKKEDVLFLDSFIGVKE